MGSVRRTNSTVPTVTSTKASPITMAAPRRKGARMLGEVHLGHDTGIEQGYRVVGGQDRYPAVVEPDHGPRVAGECPSHRLGELGVKRDRLDVVGRHAAMGDQNRRSRPPAAARR